jgi:hypothetical protein
MRKNLGSIFLLFFLFFYTEVFASTYTWSATISKKTAYLHEPVYIRYVCTFSDASELYTIDFNPAKEYEKYTVKNLRQSESIIEGKRVNSYEFVVYPKETGEIIIKFDALMKKTTKESIENTVIGRDNVQKEDFFVKKFKQKSFKIDVKETNSTLVGDFALKVKTNKPEVKAYEPYHMQIIIDGVGNFEAIKPIEFTIEDVKIFAAEPTQRQTLHEDGLHGEWSQKFAFVSEKDFIIPKTEIEYFNLKEQKIKSLAADNIEISVAKGFSKEELLDEEEKEKFVFNYDYLYFSLFFITGFFVGKIKIKKRAFKESEDKRFLQKIDEAKSMDELMVLLVLKNAKKYEKTISDIEAKKIVSLRNAKRLILD